MTIEIHTSDVKTFLECRRKWDYSSMLRQAYEPLLPNMNLLMGRVMHDALAHWYSCKNAKESLEHIEGLWAAEIDHYKALAVGDGFTDLLVNAADLTYSMLRHYILYSRRRDRFEVLKVEQRMAAQVPFLDDVAIVGRLDLVCVDEADNVFIIDHKTSSRIPNEQDVQVDMQPLTYLFLQPQASYFVYNFLFKREPRIPTVLKNGRLSKAKLSDTTLEIYNARLKSVKQSWDLYPDVYLELTSQPNKFFVRYNVIKMPVALSLHASNLSAIASEMVNQLTPIYPSPDQFKCGWCAFREPCSLESCGTDPAVLLASNFVRRKEWH